MKKTNTYSWKSFINFIAYVSTACIGLALLIGVLFKSNGSFSTALTTVASILAYLITAIVSFSYARTKRNIVYWVIWLISVTLIIIGLILSLV